MWPTLLADYRKMALKKKGNIILASRDNLGVSTNRAEMCAVTLNKRDLWASLRGVITENRLQGTSLGCYQGVPKCTVRAGNTSVSHLIRTGVVIGPASDNKELSSAAGHGRRADRLLHRSHLCPAVGEGVVALHAVEAALAVVSAHGVHLTAEKHTTRLEAGKGNYGLKVSTHALSTKRR